MQQESIMIVDDMTSTLEIMKLLFTNAGYKDVYTFDCPLRALHEIDQGVKPDIIISDFHMPHLNGIQFLESAASTLKKTKSVIMSGDTTSIKPLPRRYKVKVIDKGDPDFFKKLLSLIKSFKRSKSVRSDVTCKKNTAKKISTSEKITFTRDKDNAQIR
jgi:DNA-binding NtrC family response regulator